MRAFLLLVALVLAATGIGIGAQASSTGDALPTGALTSLQLAGSLAVGPRGELYVAAPSQHQILVRLANGRLHVVAGDGRNGFSGDGGPALQAQLSDPTELTFAPSGALYFVDGGRVRMISPNGLITAIAGDGVDADKSPGSPSPPIAAGAPAGAASLGSSPSITLSSSGELYLATSTQLLRLTSAGRLALVRTRRLSFRGASFLPGSLDMNLGSLGVDGGGDLYVSGFNGWAVWCVRPDGGATYLGYDRGSGGSVPDLALGPDGAVYAENGGDIVRLGTSLANTTMVPVYDLSANKILGQYFWLTDFAFGPGGARRPSRSNLASSASSAAFASANIFSTASSIVSLVTLGCMDAGAAIFVPSSATRPTPAIPAFSHSRSEEVKIVLSASSCRWRNRATVVWSGSSPAQTTRKATSTWHARSIWRDERTPTQ